MSRNGGILPRSAHSTLLNTIANVKMTSWKKSNPATLWTDWFQAGEPVLDEVQMSRAGGELDPESAPRACSVS